MMEDRKELLKALLSARKEFKPCKMSGRNPFFGNSKYSTLDDIKDACEEALLKHGILAYHTLDDDKLTCHVVHAETGQELTSTIQIRINYDDEDDVSELDPREREKRKKRNITQEMGAWITYLRRYTLAPLLGVVADEDIDANSAYQQSAVKQAEQAGQPKSDGKVDSRHQNLAFLICTQILYMTDEVMRADIKKYFPDIQSRSQMTAEQWEQYVKILNDVHLKWKITEDQKNDIEMLLGNVVNSRGERVFKSLSDPKFIEHLSNNVCKQLSRGAVVPRRVGSIDDVLYFEAEYIKRRLLKKEDQQ